MCKMNLKHIILMLATGLLAACTQDELTGQGASLPEGKYPLELTANLTTATRATVDNEWDANTEVHVQIINDYQTGTAPDWTDVPTLTYTVGTDGTMIPTGNTPQTYWKDREEHKLIRAWWRGDNSSSLESSFSVSDNQSQAYPTNTYDASDFVFAQDEITFEDGGNGASLTFYHQVAKVILNIKNDNISSYTISGASLQILYLSGTFTPLDISDYYGTWSTAGNWNFITMKSVDHPTGEYKANYEAIVIPQTISKNHNVFQIVVSGYTTSSFYYKTPEEFTWKPGYVYTYDVTVKPTGLEVETNESIDNWDAGSSGSGSVEI